MPSNERGMILAGIVDALATLKEAKGSTGKAIVSYIRSNPFPDMKKSRINELQVKKAIQKAVGDNILKQCNGRYMIDFEGITNLANAAGLKESPLVSMPCLVDAAGRGIRQHRRRRRSRRRRRRRSRRRRRHGRRRRRSRRRRRRRSRRRRRRRSRRRGGHRSRRRRRREIEPVKHRRRRPNLAAEEKDSIASLGSLPSLPSMHRNSVTNVHRRRRLPDLAHCRYDDDDEIPNNNRTTRMINHMTQDYLDKTAKN